MALRTCTVSFTGASGVRRSVEVTARIHLRGCSSRRLGAEKRWLGRRDGVRNRAWSSGARAAHLSSAHRSEDSSLVRWCCGPPYEMQKSDGW